MLLPKYFSCQCYFPFFIINYLNTTRITAYANQCSVPGTFRRLAVMSKWRKEMRSLLSVLLIVSVVGILGMMAERIPAHAQQREGDPTGKTDVLPTDGVIRNRADGSKEAYLPTIEPTSHAANLIALKNSELLCFWFTGKAEGESGVGIAISRLSPGSHRWSVPVIVDRQEGYSYQNPVPFQAPDGTLWLFHTRQAANAGQANAQVLVLRSQDNGHTWSKPEVLFSKAGAFVRNPPIIMSDGGWLLPMYFTPSKGITTGAESNYSVMMISHDRGKSWKQCVVPHSDGYVQPSVIRLPDDHYIAFFRSRFADSIFKSTSTDGCRWTTPVATQLPNNNASIQAIMLADRHIVIAFDNSRAAEVSNKAKEGPRKPLAVALSTDEGATWKFIRNVEEGSTSSAQEEFSYPSIIQDTNGELDLAFTYRRQAIKFLQFPESWISQK